MYSQSYTVDENSYYLNRYEAEQDELEENYIASLEDKKEAVMELASEILKGSVDEEEFYLAFKDWYCEDTDEYDTFLLETLDAWGANELQEEDYLAMCEFAELALEAACEIITGDFLHNVATDGNWRLKVMISDVVGEL